MVASAGPYGNNHTSTSPLSFLQAGYPSCCTTNSVKAPKAANIFVCISACITVADNATWNSSDDLSSYLPNNHRGGYRPKVLLTCLEVLPRKPTTQILDTKHLIRSSNDRASVCHLLTSLWLTVTGNLARTVPSLCAQLHLHSRITSNKQTTSSVQSFLLTQRNANWRDNCSYFSITINHLYIKAKHLTITS